MAYLLRVKRLDEFGEVLTGVVGPGRGLRMVLHSENRQFFVPNTFDGAIIEVNMRYLKLIDT